MFQTIEDLQEIIVRRKQKLSLTKSTLQPFGLMVGPLNMITEFQVHVGDVVYKFDSLLRAFEILFKAFHALSIKYPIESQHLWYFIEPMTYDMKCRNSSASALISDLKPHLHI